jgi:hypothetical protein
VLNEVRKLLDDYKDEEVSITVTGHSLGAAMATLNAVDIVYNGYNLKPDGVSETSTDEPIKDCLVTAFVFGGPHIGDEGFRKVFSDLKNLHVLRVNNKNDVVPSLPPLLPYVDVGKEFIIDTSKSPYLKSISKFEAHNLEIYMHGVAGTHGEAGEFKLEVNREIALVNKESDALKDDLPVPVLDNWWTTKNKSMVQNDDGSWVLMDHESDDNDTIITL